jgi:hypothetical protein
MARTRPEPQPCRSEVEIRAEALAKYGKRVVFMSLEEIAELEPLAGE